MIKPSVLLLLGILGLTSCSTPRPIAVSEPQFTEENNADIVIRHYSEEINRVLKPLQVEGPFMSTFDKEGVLDLAKQQSGRALAVVILLQFNCSDGVKRDWMSLLEELGYERIVFLRAQSGLKINGLPILENPSEITVQQKKQPEPSV